jgi:hypothetical protein
MNFCAERPEANLLLIIDVLWSAFFPSSRHIHITVTVHEKIKSASILQERKESYAGCNLANNGLYLVLDFLVALLTNSDTS